MSEVNDRYRRRADAFERKVAAVRPEQWSNQSPCEDWTARDVLGHVIGALDQIQAQRGGAQRDVVFGPALHGQAVVRDERLGRRIQPGYSEV